MLLHFEVADNLQGAGLFWQNVVITSELGALVEKYISIIIIRLGPLHFEYKKEAKN